LSVASARPRISLVVPAVLALLARPVALAETLS
jgi:hypothetical protein